VSPPQTKGGMGGGLVPGKYPPPRSLRPEMVGEKFAVVSGHPLVSMVANDIFAAGGNAIDAGVAAGLASNVVQVDMANFGGIAPILVRPAGSAAVSSIAGVGRWSKTAGLDEMLARHGGALPLDGAPAIVPAAPAAWLQALSSFGTMSLDEVAEPAIRLASDGFLLDPALALSLDLSFTGFGQWPSSVEVYRPHGKPLTTGERLQQPALADTLRRLVEAEKSASGSREQRIRAAHNAFYSGEIANIIVNWVTEHGGFMTIDDLSSFDAEVGTTASIDIRDWTFHSTPSWSQGPVALQILGILSRLPNSWHHAAEAITLAFNDREDYLCDPDYMEKAVADLLSDNYLNSLADSVSDVSLPGRQTSATKPGNIISSTTSIVTIDAGGNVFSTSPSDTLDGGPIIPELGIMCSPRGVQSRLDPSHPNRLRPGGRPTITPAPMIALKGNDAWAIACPGGDVIVQAMAQVVWRVMRDGVGLQEAVEAPRIAAFNAPSAFHPHPSADRLVYAEGRLSEDDISTLRKHGHTVEVWPDFEFDAGSVQMVRASRTTRGDVVIDAAADPRRLAYAIVR
jgi:gamma-glutamyltranspeptidase / glutathione hydrolase